MIDDMWVYKYQPKKIDEIIIPKSVKEQGHNMIRDGLVNMILSGSSGTGKTTFAFALCLEANCDYIVYNGSDGSLNMEELRTKIESFALTRSIAKDAKQKVVIIDEADGLSGAIQGALRNAIDKYSKTCRFILTCNYPEKLISAIHSRCPTINFDFDKKEQNSSIRGFAYIASGILKRESVEYDVEVLKSVILKYYPDNRQILNELQLYSKTNKKIDSGMMEVLSSRDKELFDFINDGDFNNVKQWLTDNCSQTIINNLYKVCEKYIKTENLPLFILCIGEAQQWHNTVPSQELNILSYLTKYMSEV